MKIDKNKKIGLALGGGAALGAAHIGVLKVLEEKQVKVNYISGTSIGAFIASLYAFGKTCDEIEKIAENMNWLNISSFSPSKFGLLSNEKLADIVKDSIGDRDFSEADIPLAMIATDIAKGEKIILNKGSVTNAVMASTCIPGIFVPVKHKGKMLVDGGIMENVPVSPLKEMGAELIIAVDLVERRRIKKPTNIVGVLLNTFNLALIYPTKMQKKKANIIINPDLSSFNMTDPRQVPDLIKKGYQKAKKIL